jgi:uncharacterized membrane protein YdbT with pleckstrin-like domain
MGTYASQTLTTGEHIVYEGKPSWWAELPLFSMAVLCLMLAPQSYAFLIIALAVCVVAYLRHLASEVAVTNKRVVAKFGLIRRSAIELKLEKIQSIQVHQPFFGRIFNFGSIVLAGGGMAQAPIPGISQPMQFRLNFLAAQDAIEQSLQRKE